jgi:hypothetical protein
LNLLAVSIQFPQAGKGKLRPACKQADTQK